MRDNKFEITVIGDIIFRIKFTDGADINLSDAEKINEHLLQLAKGRKYCVLLDAQNQFTTSPESREYVGKKPDRIAFAIVSKSIANMLVGNFFIQFNKPVTATKLFSDEKSALKWLQEEIVAFPSHS